MQPGIINPRRMRSKDYSSQFVCVCVSVYLSVTALTATYLVCKTKVRYHRVLSRKFWSTENFGLGGQNLWNIGPSRTEIFENFGPIMEKWSTHLSLKLIASDVNKQEDDR